MGDWRDFENIRQIRARLNSVKDDALINLSSKALPSVKKILKASGGTAKTSAHHIFIQSYENLNTSIQRLDESMRFLDESQGDIKRDWEVLTAEDSRMVRGALTALLSCCESLDKEDASKRVKSESENLKKLMNDLEKIKKNDPKSCEALAELSYEFEFSLRNFDNILGGTEYPVSKSRAYSKFSSNLEDLGERIKRLNESLKFFENELTREDWKYFMAQDLSMLREALKNSYSSSMRLVDSIAQ